MVTGEKGWLPYGTDCSGEDKREAYCVKVGGGTLMRTSLIVYSGLVLNF